MSRARLFGLGRTACVIKATMYGWEIVWPWPIGKGMSA